MHAPHAAHVSGSDCQANNDTLPRVWLFANNPLGARASANLYSLVATARANGIEPGPYLNFLFENLEALLPWNARSSIPATRRAA